MPKRGPPPPSRLSHILAHLNTGPRLELPGLKALRISLASQNDHFGARHFVKHDLPRIRYANPDVPIQVMKQRKAKEDNWRPEMVVELADNTTHSLNLQDKWSSAILKELVDVATSVPQKSTGKSKYKLDKTALTADYDKIPPSIAQMSTSLRTERLNYPTLQLFLADKERLDGRIKEGVAAALP